MAHGAASAACLSFEGADCSFGTATMGFDMRDFLKSFIRDESGAAAAEYALILAIVGAGIAIAAKNLGTAISSAINNAQSNV
jgi:pilus assembly protein Flp/PilA